jgi:predicted Zn-dependent protease
MFACRSLGNSALVRHALKDIVEAGKLPGLEAQQDWIYPPDRYVYEYADFLRGSTDTRDRAESLLLKLIGRRPFSAGAWHNLADLLWQKSDRPGALLSYRISSCLAEGDEHYARAYADALAAERREEEAFQWLEARARRFRNAPHAANPWMSWISALEDCGYPERALSA